MVLAILSTKNDTRKNILWELSMDASEKAKGWGLSAVLFEQEIKPRRRDIRNVSTSLHGLQHQPQSELLKTWSELQKEYRPRTPLGRKLLKIRKEIVASGSRLLTWDEIETEIALRRCGVEEEL